LEFLEAIDALTGGASGALAQLLKFSIVNEGIVMDLLSDFTPAVPLVPRRRAYVKMLECNE
jgi:hypothetical protein